jgi:hypothetical protein
LGGATRNPTRNLCRNLLVLSLVFNSVSLYVHCDRSLIVIPENYRVISVQIFAISENH